MTAFCGAVIFDQRAPQTLSLQQHVYRSPLKSADHYASYYDDRFGIVCQQHFVRSQCQSQLLPYKHVDAGYVVVGNIYLANRKQLIATLGLAPECADAAIVMAAYLKWHERCAFYLDGKYAFVIWDQSQLYMAVDHSGASSLYYRLLPGKYFSFANAIYSLRSWFDDLTVNDEFFKHYALDSFPPDMTCHQEIFKLKASHYLTINQRQDIKLVKYWQPRRKQFYFNRQSCYQLFREKFAETIENYLPEEGVPCTQISGGLDSSSVTAVAAQLLAKKQRKLLAFTAISQDLVGDCHYKKGWRYDELDLVQAVLDQYSNIRHYIHKSNHTRDIFQRLAMFYPNLDQPIRNVFNWDWVIASFEYAVANKATVLLIGQSGEESISWAGYSVKKRLALYYKQLKKYFNLDLNYVPMRPYLHNELLYSALSKQIQKTSMRNFNPRLAAINKPQCSGVRNTRSALEQHFALLQLDPTADRRLLSFCYNIPDRFCYAGRHRHERRLLVRRGLTRCVPDVVLQNQNRGLQAEDWYLQYNNHYQQWFERLQRITDDDDDHPLWQIFHRQVMMSLCYAVNPEKYWEYNLSHREIVMRCLNTAFFYDYVQHYRQYLF